MGWAVCTPTVIYNAFRLQKRPKKSHKDYAAVSATPAPGQPLPLPLALPPPASETLSLSRSLSTDDSGSENNSSVSVFTQDEEMQLQVMEAMRERERDGEHRCPCGCPGQTYHEEREAVRMRTKEVVNSPLDCASGTSASTETMDHVFGFEVLRHQGRQYCPEDIAQVWKKDCRMWLWKSKGKPIRTAGGKDQPCS